ncbi:MAG TPA: GDP-mannose 4,6-dehydratase [Flavitalea sp.]|nr:GDP-mannose 4,6-dehydratase [Flavitalea sp.]
MTAIIIGIGGQDGQYLSDLLHAHGITVIGVDRAGLYHTIDLTNLDLVSAFLAENQPDYVFHLAADSTTRHESWKQNHDTISTGTLNILESLYRHSPSTKLFLSGSGLQFINTGKPITATDAFDASSMYAVSRIHTTYAARYYRTLGLKVYNGYFFNHDSPRRSERHINKLITNTINRIAEGSTEMLEIGSLSVKKEFGYAGDIVGAIWTLVNQDRVFEATIGTGEAYSIQQWIECCCRLKGLDWHKHVKQKQGFNPEYDILVSDPTTIFQLGWRPAVSMEHLAQLMLDSK